MMPWFAKWKEKRSAYGKPNRSTSDGMRPSRTRLRSGTRPTSTRISMTSDWFEVVVVPFPISIHRFGPDRETSGSGAEQAEVQCRASYRDGDDHR